MIKDACYWVYILLCDNGSYYTGYTNNLPKRYALHVAGKASKFTRSFKPVKIAQYWKIDTISGAKKLEIAIKKLTREQKARLIQTPQSINDFITIDGDKGCDRSNAI